MGRNHVIDPTFFNDAIAEFGFYYDWYIQDSISLDELRCLKTTYKKLEIYGSLQTQGSSLNFRTDGNTEKNKYNFYCSSLYRIKIGDFIYDNNLKKWLHVDSVHEYDEWGVRSCTLTMIELMNYKDLEESVRFLEGEEFI